MVRCDTHGPRRSFAATGGGTDEAMTSRIPSTRARSDGTRVDGPSPPTWSAHNRGIETRHMRPRAGNLYSLLYSWLGRHRCGEECRVNTLAASCKGRLTYW
jgi:hypothetical protein